MSNVPAIISVDKWRKEAGFSRTQVWRLRRAGILQCCTIANRLYVTAEHLATFLARAEAGSLAHITKNKSKQ